MLIIQCKIIHREKITRANDELEDFRVKMYKKKTYKPLRRYE